MSHHHLLEPPEGTVQRKKSHQKLRIPKGWPPCDLLMWWCSGVGCQRNSSKVVPAEMTVRPVRLQHLCSRVLGDPDGMHITLVNYTMHSVGFHFDFLCILGDDPFLHDIEVQAS